MRPLLAFLWLSALLLRPAAQDDGLTLSARAGFDGFYREASTIPIAVTVANDGAPLEGEIRVTTPGSFGPPVVYSAPVSLPTDSEKRVNLYVYSQTLGSELNVEFISDDQVVATTQTNRLSTLSPDNVLYGVISPDPGALAFLTTVSGRSLGSQVAFLDLADLPDVSVAWNALDMVVLDDVDTARLSAGQLAALRAWVENGGQLVVTGGPGGPKTAAAVADLLPVTVGSVVSVPDLPALSDFGGAPSPAPGPYTLTDSSLRQGELLLHQDGQPLLAHLERGRGGVFFLALDPKLAPLAGWPDHARLWGLMADAVPELTPWSNGVQDGFSAAQAVSVIPGLRLPSVGQLLLFLAAYTLVIGPINFLVLRRLRRRELAWVTIPVLVLLFSAITYFTAFRTRGSAALLNEMSVAYGSIDAERVRTQSVLGLYSPQRGRYDLALPYDTTARPLGDSFGAAPGGTVDAIVRAGDLRLSEIRTDTGAIATFLVDAHLPRPPLSGEASLSEDGATLTVVVHNDSPTTLEDAVVAYGDQQNPLGDMPPGTTRQMSLRLPAAAPSVGPARPTPDPFFSPGIVAINPFVNDPSHILGTADYFNDATAYPRWQLLQSLYYTTFTGLSPAPAAATELVTLGGWLAGSGQTIDTGQTPMTQSATTLVLLEIPVR